MTDAAGEHDLSAFLERFGRKLAAGEVVFRAGDPASTTYLLREGRIRLVHRIGTRERGLRVVRPGELFGETGLVPGASRGATAVAILESTALELDADAFGELLAAEPSLGLELIQQVSRRLRDSEHQIETLMLKDSQLKVVVALIQLAGVTGSSGDEKDLAVSPLELSARVGLDVDTVKRNVQQLRATGYLDIVEERVHIPDIGALRELRDLLEVKDTLAGPGGGESIPPRRADSVAP
jgi:CRP-like cAMP-binding protein